MHDKDRPPFASVPDPVSSTTERTVARGPGRQPRGYRGALEGARYVTTINATAFILKGVLTGGVTLS
jgi:hypothetical protein